MSSFSADLDSIRTYGATSAAIGDALAAAGAMNLAANVAVMTPIFGLIGQDFLSAFGLAQFNNASSVAALVTVHNGMAAAAEASARSYESCDIDTAIVLGKAGAGL